MRNKFLLISLCLQSSIALGRTNDDQLYQDALAKARAGQLEPALQELQTLVEKQPERKRYLFDYVQILSWADRNDEVMRQAAKIQTETAPVYVLEAIAKAARSLGDYPKAETLYRLAISQSPKRLTPKLGIGLVMIDQGQAKEANEYLGNLEKDYPREVDIPLALAHLHQQGGQYSQAVEYYQKALALQPDRVEARRGLILSLAATGSIKEALDMADSHREVLTDEQWAGLNWDHATLLLRKGEQALEKNRDDYAGIDQAIEVLNANIASVDHLKLKEPQLWLTRAQADLMVALSDRKRMADAAENYLRVQQQGRELPVYARKAAADALMNSHQPEQARDLYLSLVKDNPDDFQARASLVRAYLETGQKPQMLDALQGLKTLMETLPDKEKYLYDYVQLLSWADWNDEVMRQTAKIDKDKAPAYVLEAIAKAARNLHDYQRADEFYRLAEAREPASLTPKLGRALVLLDRRQARPAIDSLQNLLKDLPNNPDIILALAYAHELQGQFQRAAEYYQQALAIRPDWPDARLGLIKAQASSGRFEAALAMAKQYRALLTDEQWANLNWDYATRLIRQGQQALAKRANDYALLDRAIPVLLANIASLPRLKLKDRVNWLTRAQADLLLVLHDSKRLPEAIELYRSLVREGSDIPVYARMAAADAYLKTGETEAARAIYAAIAEQYPDDFDSQVALARTYLETGPKDQIDPALRRLEALVEKYPEKRHYRYDYLQLLSWNDRHAEVIEQAARIDTSHAPVDVWEAIARAERNLGDYPRAEEAYRQAMSRAPDRLAPRLGIGLLLLDRQQVKPAILHFQTLARDFPDEIDVMLAEAYAQKQDNQFQKAGELYRRVLAIRPDHREAHRGLVFALAASGDFRQALEIAAAHRPLFSDQEWAGLRWDFAAALIRQGEQDLAKNARDYRAIDQAMVEIGANIALADRLELGDPQAWRLRAQSDLLVAQRDRKRFSEVIALYRDLQRQGINLPIYARMAAADAYLNNRQPKVAREIYLAVSREAPDYFNAKASLVYAYLEAEQPDKALALAERLAGEQPEKIEAKQADGSVVVIDNPRKIPADLTAAVFRAYVDDLKTAQKRLESLHERYPDNADVHSKLAEVYYFRGWPREAKQQIEEAGRKAPEHFGLKLGQAKVAHELRDYPTEGRITRELYDAYPEDSGALRQMRAWEKYNSPELKLFANGGISNTDGGINNPVIGSDNVGIDAYLYSSPIAYNYRVFTHEGWKTGLFNEGRGFGRHYGVGLEYAKGDWLASAETHYDNFRMMETLGVDLAVDYQLSDRWQLFTRLSSRDDNISLRALNSGVTAKSARLGTIYRVSESRQFSVTGGFYDFSDNNDRFMLDGSYYERWYSGPIYKFGTYLNAGFSTNNSNEGAYYSPSKDASLSLTLDNDWLTYRHYETAFYQRLALSVGDYWQENYGSNLVGNLQYEHRWRLGNNVELSYGGARSYRYYDGNPTEGWQMYLTADVRF